MRRRRFIQQSALAGIGMASSMPLWARPKSELTRITILHTNDWHSRIEPFPLDGSRNAGKGGIERRAIAIKEVRAEQEHVLLLDSGDIFQGTPYFNFFGGELEFKLMSQLSYDASTMGNHDFDNGVDGLVKVLPHASFPFVISNYDVSATPLDGLTREYLIKQYDGIRIGIFGLGIELEGLVPETLYVGTVYQDPVTVAQRMVDRLRHDMRCDYVICLSHLGFQYTSSKIDDMGLAASTVGIDLILGGHTHTFMDEPTVVPDLSGAPVLINQAGWAGIVLGRVDLIFEKSNRKKCVTCHNKYV